MLTNRICALIANPRPLSPAELDDVRLSFADTLAVALAGWHSESVTMLRGVLGLEAMPPLPETRPTTPPEAIALALGTAAHALDYDDVNLDSVTHPSAVIVPALLAVAAHHPDLTPRIPAAYAVGLTTDQTLGQVLGFAHYDKGWHASSTFGPLSAAAALAHLLDLDERQIRSALALAATRSAGMQLNFGQMGKHLQIGQSAEGAVRAALLARAGFTGAADPFAPSGFFDLYAGAALARKPDDVAPELSVASISRKLFPCCYLTHRMIAASITLHDRFPGGLPDGVQVDVAVPYGGLSALRVKDPLTGSEAKFCAAYTVAVALLRGRVLLSDFSDGALASAEVRDLMTRVTASEEPLIGAPPTGIDHGEVVVTLRGVAGVIDRVTCRHYPGSPAAPATQSAMHTKIDDCLRLYTAAAPVPLAREDLLSWLDRFIGPVDTGSTDT
ncbi:MAG: MmgE/PrpD family protein [Rhodobacter sp.]|nr:MmgE/PrpD family protein [Paracoccaceae bacterium]MCC0078162.1 MmgE/PrpD family protein [Rhodobacter sp.]